MKPQKTVLKNGLRIVTVPMKDNPTVTVLVMVEAGTKYETPKNNGLSHFLEHMCFKGTVTRNYRDIASEIETYGAETNAFTSYDYTGYYIKGKSRDAGKFLEIVSDVYLNSTFPEAEIEKERGVICGEIDMYEDMPARKIHDIFAESLYGDQPAGMPVIGPKSNIMKFSRKDFIDYHKQYYNSGATAVIVAGDVKHADIVKQVTTLFKNIPNKSAIKKQSIKKTIGKKAITKTKSIDQAHIVLGTRLPHAEHPDMAALTVASCILGNGMGSRLFLKLREEMGAGYYVRSSVNASNDVSDFTISTGTEVKRVPEVIRAIHTEVQKLQTEKIPDTDMSRAKEYLIGRLYMGLESSDDIATYVGYEEILHLKLKTPVEMEREIRKVTTADIMRVAKKYLDPKKLHVVQIVPGKK
jgi:predicted Zn-dependent peptidase